LFHNDDEDDEEEKDLVMVIAKLDARKSGLADGQVHSPIRVVFSPWGTPIAPL
jgi:hypothetical protein